MKSRSLSRRRRGASAVTSASVFTALELLEHRRLLAINIFSGVLTIDGTTSTDVITVNPAATAGQVTVKHNATARTYASSSFSSIAVYASGGNDKVMIANSVTKPAKIFGGGGNDSLVGGGGNDTLDGEAGADTMKGGGGNDTIDYSSRQYRVTVGLGTLSDDGEAGEKDNAYNDVETVLGGRGNDALKGTAGRNLLVGGLGEDLLLGLGGNDTLMGGEDDDVLEGGAGADVMKGGSGDDTVDYSARTAGVIVGLGTLADDGEVGEKDNAYNDIETLIGGNGNDTLSGSAGANMIIGGPGNDSIRGNGGNDSLSGDEGTDTLNGDAGFDTAFNQENDNLINIENPPPGAAVITPDRTLLITGTDAGDTITGGFIDDDVFYDVNAGGANLNFNRNDFDRVVINPRGGWNQIFLDFGSIGLSANIDTLINGGEENDSILLTACRASVIGNGGNDFVQLYQGAQVSGFDGGAGDDRIDDNREAGNSLLDLRLYPTVEQAAVSGGTIIGNDLDNILWAQAGTTTLLGGGGNDLLVGGNGSDSLDGQAGNDTLQGGDYGADIFRGGTGNDWVDYWTRTEKLTLSLNGLADDGAAGEGDSILSDIENISGGDSDDVIIGNAGANYLLGGFGNDSIRGGDGNDTLAGQDGVDTLNGEGGTDTAANPEADILISIENS